MKFERITPDSCYFDSVKKIYETSFPPEEKRDLTEKLFTNPNYSLLAVLEEDIIGFLSVWDLGNFVFIEHFAVVKELRDQGIGTKMLVQYLSDHNNVILEVEMPQTEDQYLRIKFYEKIGFKLCVYPYVQPSYGPGKPPVSLFLMSYPRTLGSDDFAAIKEKLYKTVYGL
ncbi:Acetyltransferase (GNAT) domain protein [Candidatus Bilamarchaeum dharawalense]|uniref:Acetyltransferase (GNAT) domain protein n=1 Tax=Candidatus Bilamarchaeum dharawalense TaxID=2885759 RepID=A0A5E4LS51_9ARCH|nr:Acetyltransferase (GNAT) domain protein [Candidatus Bilamarchaeum dharawalense]